MSYRDADEVADAIADALEVESRKLCKESPDGVQGKFDSYYLLIYYHLLAGTRDLLPRLSVD